MVCITQYLIARFLIHNEIKIPLGFCLHFYQQSSLYLILLPFLSQVEFFFICSFPFLLPELFLSSHPTFILVLLFFLFVFVFLLCPKFLIISFPFFFCFLYVSSSHSHLCHKAFTLLILFQRQTQ